MAILEKLVVQDYRNIALAELEFSANINCISGGNGEGKTNLLDAIWYMSMTKSAFRASDRDNFRYGADGFSLSGTYLMQNALRSRFSIKVTSKGEKKLRRDEKPYQRISEHIGELPVVMVSPDDVSLVSDSGEDRRRFMNMVLSQMDKEYLSDVQQYNRLLSQRNTVLKTDRPDISLLEILDERMSLFAMRIYERRKRFTEDLSLWSGSIISHCPEERKPWTLHSSRTLTRGHWQKSWRRPGTRTLPLAIRRSGRRGMIWCSAWTGIRSGVAGRRGSRSLFWFR